MGTKFIRRILTPEEIANAPLKKPHVLPLNCPFISYLAKHYAAKEAYAKAMGTGIGCDLSFQQIEIARDERGRPYFTPKTKIPPKCYASLSLSDEYIEASSKIILAYVVISQYNS